MESIVKYMYIEVTRRCNMHCKHCQRGDAQNVDLSREDVDALLSNFTCIQYLCLGGGEPTLNPDIIEYIVDKIIEKKIIVNSLGMVTNGQVYSQKVADAFNRFDEYSKHEILKRNELGDNFISGHVRIGFSDDRFHKPREEVKEAYKRSCPWITFTTKTVEEKNIIKTGRSTIGRDFKYVLPTPIYKVGFINNKPCVGICQFLNMSANGYINTNDDGSYIDHDKKNYGHVSSFSLIDFLLREGIQVRSPKNEAFQLKDYYFLNIREILLQMGCDENTIYKLTGFIEDKTPNVPVHEKILRPGNMWRKK